jgi:hypothetical protein
LSPYDGSFFLQCPMHASTCRGVGYDGDNENESVQTIERETRTSCMVVGYKIYQYTVEVTEQAGGIYPPA